MLSGFYRQQEMTALQKLVLLNWGLVAVIAAIACIGFAMLYSAADGSFDPWASRQMARFAAGLLLMAAVALVDIRVWFRHAYLLYLGALAMLVAVEVIGSVGMGAQRWISLGPINVQPSEIMKLALILVLARYFHSLPPAAVTRARYLLWPVLLILAPAVLVQRQPDLGTALMILAIGTIMLFLAGVRLWKFGAVAAVVLAAIPIAWQFLKPYQQRRVLSFFNPESDPLGAGWHTLQAKIAAGSGGITGKGYMSGTQAHLNFLPEKQTDFIFTMLAEEFGLMGGVGLLALYALVLVYGFSIALRAQSHFGRLLALGVTAAFFLYVFTNIAMVMGLIPIVGVPLPLISYGGTSMITLLVGFGLVMGVGIHRDVIVTRSGAPSRAE